jgi:hypothetical protein
MTVQQHWDDSIPGVAHSGRPWERPFLRGKISVKVRGITFYPRRIGSDGEVFRLAVTTRDGRSLKIIVPPDFPCVCLPAGAGRPLPPHWSAEALGFGPRDTSRPVTDADDLVLDLSGKYNHTGP